MFKKIVIILVILGVGVALIFAFRSGFMGDLIQGRLGRAPARMYSTSGNNSAEKTDQEKCAELLKVITDCRRGVGEYGNNEKVCKQKIESYKTFCDKNYK